MRWLAFVAILTLPSCSDGGGDVVLPDASPWVHDLQRSEPDRCLTDEDCTIYGYCATEPNTDKCWALDGPHCGSSMACYYNGLCTFRVVAGRNECVAATDADCARSRACKSGGACHACKHACQIAYCS